MSKIDPKVIDAVMEQVHAALGQTTERPVIIGVCGPQGAGKTTLCRDVMQACANEGLRPATLSIDDLYLTRAERLDLARQVHPLLATRGVPGTHDVELGLSLIADLRQGQSVPLPRFDKSRDDRAPRDDWPTAPAGCEVLLFEGWCVGARAQDPEHLVEPINALEANDDPDGQWRGYVNAALGSAYLPLFACLDRLILLAAPSFDVVHEWRCEQERELATQVRGGDALMDEPAIARFIAHYERLTRFILDEMPDRANLVVQLDRQRHAIAIRGRC